MQSLCIVILVIIVIIILLSVDLDFMPNVLGDGHAGKEMEGAGHEKLTHSAPDCFRKAKFSNQAGHTSNGKETASGAWTQRRKTCKAAKGPFGPAAGLVFQHW